MDKLCSALVTIIAAFISFDTIRRLFVERHRLIKEDLSDYDLAFVWRIVIFLVYPLLNLFALWGSVVACQWFGGYVRNASYGLLWYQLVPAELSSPAYLIPVLFAGEIVQTFFVLISLAALFFRPHPFLAMVLTYSTVFVCAINFIADPLLSIVGFGSTHWQMAINQGSKQDLANLAIIHAIAALLFIVLLNTPAVRRLFAELIRPVAMEKLKQALAENKTKENVASASNLVMLYEGAGLSRQANQQLHTIKRHYPQSLFTRFAEAYLSYRRRNYKQAIKLFLAAADSNPKLSNELKSMFLAAAACCAHANHDFESALNLVDRALEFEPYSSMAKMVKIDVLLRQGKEQKAAEEFQAALQAGLNQNLEQTIPIDWQRAVKLITEIETSDKTNLF